MSCVFRISIQTGHFQDLLLIRLRVSILSVCYYTSQSSLSSLLNFFYLSKYCLLSVVVDGDPHFVVQLPELHQNLCFTVDGRANDVLRLLEDPEQGTQSNNISTFM